MVRTLFERDCSFITGIFNYYHLSLLLTTLNCVADPALYCFVSESARRGLYRTLVKPVARLICCCRRRGNASPVNPPGDSHEVATDENNGQPTVTLLTHTCTHSAAKTAGTSSGSVGRTEDAVPLTVHRTSPSEDSCDVGVEEKRSAEEGQQSCS